MKKKVIVKMNSNLSVKKGMIGISRVINLMENSYNPIYRKRDDEITYEQKKELSRNLFK